MADVIDNFHGEYRFLSNFWFSPVRMQGIDYATVEHAYQAAKTLDDDLRAHIAALDSPGKAKREGQKLLLREDWEQVKVRVMHHLIKLKFQDPELAARLVATGDAKLVEGNTWGDRFWGVCGGEGRNQLGLILMDRRERLKSAQDRAHD